MSDSQIALQREINGQVQSWIPTRAWDSTVAVVVGDADHAWHIASGTLFRLGDSHFIVTAAHAIRSAINSKLPALAITGSDDRQLISVPDPWMCSTPKEGEETDPFDVAVHRLSDEALNRLTGRSFLRLADVEFGDSGPEAVYTLFGYPGLWSVPITDRSEALSLKALEFTTYAFDGDAARIPGYNKRLHILLSGGAEDVTSEDGRPMAFRDRLGQQARLPVGLKGVSGCSVWHIGDLRVPIQHWGVREPKVVGIQVGAYQAWEVLQTSRWVCVTTLLNTAFPELRPILRLQLP